MKNKIIQRKISFVWLFAIAFLQLLSAKTFAQIKQVTLPPAASQDDNTLWYVTLAVLVCALGGVVFYWLKSKSAAQKKAEKSKSARKEKDWESESLDADKEMEWLRKNQLILDSSHKKRNAKKREMLKAYEITDDNENEPSKSNEPLPVFGFQELSVSQPFSPLPFSNDESLMSAIEQVHEEDEEDEEVRDLAIRVLAAFKSRNSIEALSQVALYDLSSTLRSKAVTTLADFDHESVFETILMACADPTREVRAAGARGLSRLSFDRADAWSRIAETGEEGRMRHASRAAIEGGFVEHSFERLAHHDQKAAYEAFALLALLVKAGESEPIFEAIKKHSNENVKLAILHTIKTVKNHNALNGLYGLLEGGKLPVEIREAVDETIAEVGFVAA
ncbi:MAG: HEAT repeat domain-containing protein [Pyrinomonadaceae bacterium]